MGRGCPHVVGKPSAPLFEILLVSLAFPTNCTSSQAALMLGLEVLDGAEVHPGQFRLGGWLWPHIRPAAYVFIVLDLDAEHFEAVHCYPLVREIVDIPGFVDWLVRFSSLETARTVLDN
jgi:hypothetical protein